MGRLGDTCGHIVPLVVGQTGTLRISRACIASRRLTLFEPVLEIALRGRAMFCKFRLPILDRPFPVRCRRP